MKNIDEKILMTEEIKQLQSKRKKFISQQRQEEEIKNKEIKELAHKQLIMDIEKTKYTVNLHFKQGRCETYKDKILKLSKREKKKI